MSENFGSAHYERYFVIYVQNAILPSAKFL